MIGSRLRLLRALLAGGIAAAIAAIMPGPSPPTPPPGVAPAPAAWTEHVNGSANSEGNARIEGFWFSGDGLCLSPGTAGTIWYRVAAALPVPSRLHLDLWTHPAGRAPTRLQVSVEGHAAALRTSYPSVWELSAERATKVLRAMV